jgi:hypothetical protein
MTHRVGIEHVPGSAEGIIKGQNGEWSAYDVIRIEVPEVPVLGQMRVEADKLPTDLVEFNKQLRRQIAKAMAFGYDHGLMAAKADPTAPFIDSGYEHIFEMCHSEDPVKHAEHIERSTKRWREDTEDRIEWVEFLNRG